MPPFLQMFFKYCSAWHCYLATESGEHSIDSTGLFRWIAKAVSLCLAVGSFAARFFSHTIAMILLYIFASSLLRHGGVVTWLGLGCSQASLGLLLLYCISACWSQSRYLNVEMMIHPPWASILAPPYCRIVVSHQSLLAIADLLKRHQQ